MANERTLGLRTDDKKVEENWKKIDWGSRSKEEVINNEMSEASGIENKTFSGTCEDVKNFKLLFEVDYEDNGKTIRYGKIDGEQCFILRDNDKDLHRVFEAGKDDFMADALLGIMNELHVLRAIVNNK